MVWTATHSHVGHLENACHWMLIRRGPGRSLCDVICTKRRGCQDHCGRHEKVKVRSVGVNLSALSIEGRVTNETVWSSSSLDDAIGESKGPTRQNGAIPLTRRGQLVGERERVISSRPSVCYGSEQGLFHETYFPAKDRAWF